MHKCRRLFTNCRECQGPLNEGVSNGGVSRSGLVLPFLSFFCPFWDFPDFSGIFPICSGMVRGFFRFVLFLSLGLLRAAIRNSPERVRDTIWTFPEKKWETPRFGNPRFSFSQVHREVLHGVGADGVGVKFPIFAVNCCCLRLSFRRSREKRRKRGKMRRKRGKMRKKGEKCVKKRGKSLRPHLHQPH